MALHVDLPFQTPHWDSDRMLESRCLSRTEEMNFSQILLLTESKKIGQ